MPNTPKVNNTSYDAIQNIINQSPPYTQITVNFKTWINNQTRLNATNMNDLTAFIRAYSRAVANVLETTIDNTFKSFADLNAGWKYNPNALGTVPTETGELFNDYENNVASADYSHAEGQKTTASGEASHSEGNNTVAQGDYSHSEGNGTKATGKASHSQNFNTTASGEASTATGTATLASGVNSFSGGNSTAATGENSVALGENTQARGNTSFVFGFTSHADGDNTFVAGQFLDANSQNQVVFGQYNDNNPGNILEIGNGSSAQRKNIFSVTTEGKTIGGVDNLDKDTDSAQTLTPKGYVDEQIDRLDKNVWLGYIEVTQVQYDDSTQFTTLLDNAVLEFTKDTHPPEGRKRRNGDQITVEISDLPEGEPGTPEIWMFVDPDPKEGEETEDPTPGSWQFFSSLQPLIQATYNDYGLVKQGENIVLDSNGRLMMIWNDWGTAPTPAQPYQAEMTEESYEGGLKYTLNVIPNVIYKAEYHSEIEVQGGYFVYESVQPDEYGRYVIEVTSHIVNFLVPSTISGWSVWVYPKN